jgi:aspartate aminotransferase-like enzyme
MMPQKAPRVRDFKLFIPGPTPVADEVLAEMSRQIIGHRSGDYKTLHGELRPLLQGLFQTRGRVLTLTCSASMIMEALTRQCLRPGKRLVNLACGAFSDRWGQMASANGVAVTNIASDWGQPYNLKALEEELDRGDVDAVTLVHNETSTGVMNDLEKISALIKKHPEVFVIVDAVSSLGGVNIPFDAWGLDACLAGVQKDLACPPGLVVLSISDRLLARCQEVDNRGWALDLKELFKKDAEDFALTTPSISHMWALKKRLEYMQQEGAENRWRRHEALAQRARSWAEERFELFAPENYRSQTLTTVACPEDFDPVAFAGKIREKSGFILGGGYGKLKKSTFRIAHMGECVEENLEALLKVMESCL